MSVITGQVMKISRVWVMYWRRKADCKNLTMKMLIIKADDAKYNCWTIDDYANYIFCLSWSDPFLLFFELTKAKVCCKWVSVHLTTFIGCLRCENICCNSTIQENSLPLVHTWLGSYDTVRGHYVQYWSQIAALCFDKLWYLQPPFSFTVTSVTSVTVILNSAMPLKHKTSIEMRMFDATQNVINSIVLNK